MSLASEFPLMDEGDPGHEFEGQASATFEALSEVYDPAGIVEFANRPHPQVEGKALSDVVRERDLEGIRRFRTVVEAMATGAYL